MTRNGSFFRSHSPSHISKLKGASERSDINCDLQNLLVFLEVFWILKHLQFEALYNKNHKNLKLNQQFLLAKKKSKKNEKKEFEN